MSFDLASLPVAPAGFGNCGRCTYLGTENAALCYTCARQTMEPLARFEERCETCDHPFGEVEGSMQTQCRNPVCNMGDHNRGFQWNFAVAMRSGVIKNALLAYKYDDAWLQSGTRG